MNDKKEYILLKDKDLFYIIKKYKGIRRFHIPLYKKHKKAVDWDKYENDFINIRSMEVIKELSKRQLFLEIS